MPSKKTGIFLLTLIFLYGAQGVLYKGGNQFTQILLFLILFISGIYLVKTLSSSTPLPKFLKYWVLLLGLNVFGFILTGSLSDSIHFSMIRGILISLLTFFPIYSLAQYGLIQRKHLIILFLCFTPVFIQNWLIQSADIYSEFGKEEIVNNVSYTLILLIPYLFLFKKRKYIAYGILLLIIYFVILGSKRGAIIVGGIGVLFYFYQQVRFDNVKKNLIGYFVGLVALIGVLIYGYQFYLQNEYLISRFEQLEEGNSSGREEIYANIFSNWANSESLFNIFFGYGFAGSRQLSGKALAHNDWIELLSDFGLLGVVIYIFFFYHVFKYAIKLNVQSQYRLMLLCILTMWFATSLFSMGYVSNDGYLRSIILGYILGISNPKRSVSNNHIYTYKKNS